MHIATDFDDGDDVTRCTALLPFKANITLSGSI